MNERYETLELRRDTDLLWLVLNRPASLNAMNSLLVHELHAVARRTAPGSDCPGGHPAGRGPRLLCRA